MQGDTVRQPYSVSRVSRGVLPRIGQMVPSSPASSGAASPKRLTSAVGAVAVTVLTLAGTFGVGPGAAMGETPANRDSHRQPFDSAREDNGATGGPAHRSDGWLTIEDAPAQTGDPDRPLGEGMKSSAERQVPPRSGQGKRIVYDISEQRVWLVTRKDEVARTYPVSGGTNPETLDPGRYAVYSKSRHAVSFDYEETMNYMVRFATGERSAIGFHDIPAHEDGTLAQSRSELGTPQSAGCIRQWITDARALWEFSRIDTPVVVTP